MFLRLTGIHFPPTAIVSIMHRLSGLLLFLLILPALIVFDRLMSSQAVFGAWVACWHGHFWLRAVAWIGVAALLYHVVAGFRHLLMDGGLGESKRGGTVGAVVLLIIWLVGVVALGIVWLP